jgi:hypothetical protein
MLRRVLPLGLLFLAVPSAAFAAPRLPVFADTASGDNATIASALFEEGRKLVAAGKYEEACPKFAESQRLAPAGGTILNLAVCHEKSGKKALALTEYESALAVATRENRKERIVFAKKQIAAIEPLLAKVTVRLPTEDATAAGLEVHVDGLALPQAAFGIAVKVDAGPHVVTAQADQKREFRSEFEIVAKEVKEVVVTLSPPIPDPPKVEPPKVEPPKVEPPKVEPPKVEPPKVEPPKVEPPKPVKPRTEIRKEGHPLALPFILAGATGLVTGLAVGGYAANQLLNPNVGGSCFSDATKCADDAARKRRNAGRTGLWVSGTSFGLGTILLITGVALPSREVIVKTGGLHLRVTPTVDASAQGATFGLSGRF